MSGRSRDTSTELNDEFETEHHRSSKRRPRRRRWLWGLLLLLLTVGLLPNLVGWLGLHQAAINYAASDFRGTIKVDSFRCGWLQTVQLRGIEVTDADGQPLVSADSIDTSRTLLQLLTKSDLGIVNVFRPQAHLLLRGGGSNLEDALANYLNQPATDEPVTLPDLQINLEQGSVVMTTDRTATTWMLENVNGAVRMGADDAALLANIESELVEQSIDAQGQTVRLAPGSMTIRAQVDAGSQTLDLQSANVSLETQQLPLSCVNPILQRFAGNVVLGGQLNGKCQAFYNGPNGSVSLILDQFGGQQIGVAAPEWLGPDEILLQQLAVQGELQLTPRLVAAKEFSLSSELGKVNANGTVNVNQLIDMTQQLNLLETPVQIDGQLDVARIAQMLPETLQLHRDLTVESGTVTFQANCRIDQAQNARRLVVNMDTANIRARRGEQLIVWSKPLRLVGTVAQRNGELSIEDLICESEFFQLSGGGNWKQAGFRASGNLDILTQRLSQFVDLQETRLAGVLKGEFGWQVAQVGAEASNLNDVPLEMGGRFTVTDPLMQLAGYPAWKPGELKVQLSGRGRASWVPDPTVEEAMNQLKMRVNEGGVQVDIGSERAIATLAEPITDLLAQSRWHAQTRVTGKLENWLNHIRNFVDIGTFVGRGKIDVSSDMVASPSAIRLNGLTYDVREFGFAGYGLTIAESQVHGEGNAVVELAEAAINFRDLTLVSNSASARARDFRIQAAEVIALTGDVAFRANVNRVADWLELSPTPESLFWFGEGEGFVTFLPDTTGRIPMKLDATIKDLVAAKQAPFAQQRPNPGISNVANPQRNWLPLWQEARVKLDGLVTVGADYDSLIFEAAKLDSTGIQATIDGSLAKITSTMNANLKGTFRPDWGQINGLIAEYSGDLIEFRGTEENNFTVQGPLFASTDSASSSAWIPETLAATADIGWDSGDVMGLPIGASQLNLKLNTGIAQVATEGIPFSGGKIAFAPEVDLRSNQPIVKMGWTRLVDGVELTPETARQWLRFVAPLAADATSAQGTVSIDVGEATIPIFTPLEMEARGALRMSNVVIGAGPLAEQLIGTVEQIRSLLKPQQTQKDLRTWLRLSEQNVPIAVKEGRVYHDQVSLFHKDLTIRTRGSVGFDQTLQLVAEIPIDDDWIEGKQYLASLKGKSISIPITGTVSAPQLDKSAIQQLSQDLVRQASAAAVNKAIDKKVTPKLNEFQQKVNDKINGQLNKFQQDLNDKLNLGGERSPLFQGGGSLLPQLIPGQKPDSSSADDKGQDLLRGFGDLLKRGSDKVP